VKWAKVQFFFLTGLGSPYNKEKIGLDPEKFGENGVHFLGVERPRGLGGKTVGVIQKLVGVIISGTSAVPKKSTTAPLALTIWVKSRAKM